MTYINRNIPRTQLPVELTVRPTSTFFRDYFMGGGEEFFPTENVEWDSVIQGSPMARFVGEGLEVEATERAPFNTSEIKTPYFQEKRILSGQDIKHRLPGENIYQPQTDAERAAVHLANDREFCIRSIDNRIEYMCAQFITSGVVPIVGHGVNRKIDYGLQNKEVLTGGDRWGQTGVSILEYMIRKVDILNQLGHGVEDVILSQQAWEALRDDEEIYKLLDNRRFELGTLAPEQSKYGKAQYLGTLTDPFVNLYKYNFQWTIGNKRVKPLPDGYVIFVSETAKTNKTGYGAYTYIDETDEFRTIEGAYIEERHTDRRGKKKEIVVTSRAVPIPADISSWYVAKVV